MSARVLYTDLETAPIVAHIWGLRDLNVGINQIIRDPEVIGQGYKWGGTRGARYASTWDEGGRQAMLQKAWDLLDEADVVVHYNGDRFDIPWLNGEFARLGMTPPSPFKSLDLYKVVRKNFRFPSYKLDYVAHALLGQRKLATGGHQLWVDCLNGDEKARAKLARYCRRDTALLEPLLEFLRPWLGNQVNFALWSEQSGELACQKCGSSEFLIAKGTAYTANRAYPQVWCKPAKGGCGGWTRDSKSSWSIPSVGVQR
jgi:hypothetical protein